ncbi:MAG: thiamine pyrophosphate-dependent enzyme [Dehalococcoidia bacterium]
MQEERIPPEERGIRPEVTEKVRRLKDEWLQEWMPTLTTDEIPMNPYRVTWEFMHAVDPANTIVLHDSGSVRGYICHHYEATAPRGFLGFGGQSAMGWSVGAAMGAKLAAPHKLVVNFIGDGAFGMTGMDVETAVRNGIPTLTFIMNNESLNMSAETRRLAFDSRFIWIELSGNYAKVTEGLGAHAERVETPDQLRPALNKAIEATRAGRPAVLEVMTKKLEREPVLPDPLASPWAGWPPPVAPSYRGRRADTPSHYCAKVATLPRQRPDGLSIDSRVVGEPGLVGPSPAPTSIGTFVSPQLVHLHHGTDLDDR